MTGALKNRLKRLEAGRSACARPPTLYLGITGHHDGEVVAVESLAHGVAVERLPGESVEALRERAEAEHTHVRVWMANYAGVRHGHA